MEDLAISFFHFYFLFTNKFEGGVNASGKFEYVWSEHLPINDLRR